jgi:hypothetical protein
MNDVPHVNFGVRHVKFGVRHVNFGVRHLNFGRSVAVDKAAGLFFGSWNEFPFIAAQSEETSP